MSFSSTTNRLGPVLLASLPQPIPVTFPFQQGADLAVWDIGPVATAGGTPVLLTLNSDYTVSGGGYNSANAMQTGYVVVQSAGGSSVQVNDQIVILRGLAFNQVSDVVAAGILTVADIEQALDKNATLSQELQENLSRALQFQAGETLNGTMHKSARAGAFLAFDANGVPVFPTSASIVVSTSSPLSVTTITALRAVTVSAVANGSAVTVDGYYAANDGGGGTFTYSAASVAADDGGAVIAPTVGSGRWIRQITASVDARAFGADPTAVTDSRNQMQYACNWCGANGVELVITGNIRIGSTTPIIVQNMTIRGAGGTLWQSLPDGYSWSSYAWDAPSFANQVNSSGALVTFTPSDPGLSCPWNGKTNMFNLINAQVINLTIDGGWWATNSNAPAGYPTSQSLRGIEFTNGEYSYYQIFQMTSNCAVKNCTILNVPGAALEGIGAQIACTGNTFGEYGDHCFYIGGGSSQVTFSNNQISASRAANSTPGNRSYIFQTQREACKIRGTNGGAVVGNIYTCALGYLATLESTSLTGQAGDCSNIAVSGNAANSYDFIYISGNRYSSGTTPAVGDGTGYYVRNCIISGNTVYAGHSFLWDIGAVINLNVTGNTFVAQAGASPPIGILPNVCYVNPIQGFSVTGNNFQYTSTGGNPINVLTAGYGGMFGAGNFTYANNIVSWAAESTSNAHINLQGNCAIELLQFTIANNFGAKCYSNFVSGGTNTWSNSVAYNGNKQTFADASNLVHGSVAYYSGSWYQCYLTIPANSGLGNPTVDTAHWQAYTLATPVLNIMGTTTQYSSSSRLIYFLEDHAAETWTLNAGKNNIVNTAGVPIYNIGSLTNNFIEGTPYPTNQVVSGTLQIGSPYAASSPTANGTVDLYDANGNVMHVLVHN